MDDLALAPTVTSLGDCQCHGGQPRNFVVPCLLLLLRERPAHGYDLNERLVPFGFTGDQPMLYRNLRRMEAVGLLTSSWDTGGRGPARRVYRLTARGAAHLDACEVAVRYQRDVLDRFLARFHRANPERSSERAAGHRKEQ